MAIYAIGDLHLSGVPPFKPMEVFGPQWLDHRKKIATAWQSAVAPCDTVIICGDISWAMDIAAVKSDLDFICELPGHKIMLRGNHDYWWSSLSKNKKATGEQIDYLQNNAYCVGEWAIAGTRGWNIPGGENFTAEDEKIYKRELVRLELSLKAAQKLGAPHIMVALHYPPLYTAGTVNGFTELLEKYQVETCVYGHVHGAAAAFLNIYQGSQNGTNYRLVSADYLNFQLAKIEE